MVLNQTFAAADAAGLALRALAPITGRPSGGALPTGNLAGETDLAHPGTTMI